MFKKFLSIFVLVCVFMSITMTGYAESLPTTAGENTVIGHSIESSQVRSQTRNALPNLLTVDFAATAKSVIVTFTNLGVDRIDTVNATVTIGSVKKSISLTKVWPGTTTKTVDINMVKCHEDISVYTVATDGGTSIGSSTTTGKRDVPSNQLALWHPGNFGSAAASLDYHFGKHGSRLGISNIVSYVSSADNFRRNLSGATSSPVYGSTPNVTRYKKNGKYVDICGTPNTGKIISYGKL